MHTHLSMVIGEDSSILSDIYSKIFFFFYWKSFFKTIVWFNIVSTKCLNAVDIRKKVFFSLAEKVKIINYAKENPHLSSKNLQKSLAVEEHVFKLSSNKRKLHWVIEYAAKVIFLKKRDLKNSKMSKMLSGVGFVWQGKKFK